MIGRFRQLICPKSVFLKHPIQSHFTMGHPVISSNDDNLHNRRCHSCCTLASLSSSPTNLVIQGGLCCMAAAISLHQLHTAQRVHLNLSERVTSRSTFRSEYSSSVQRRSSEQFHTGPVETLSRQIISNLNDHQPYQWHYVTAPVLIIIIIGHIVANNMLPL